MEQDILQLKLQVEDLQREVSSLKNTTTIPYEVDTAFRDRFEIASYAKLTASSKTAASETQAVSESGVASYNVAKPPDGFREFVVGGSTLYVPYYT